MDDIGPTDLFFMADHMAIRLKADTYVRDRDIARSLDRFVFYLGDIQVAEIEVSWRNPTLLSNVERGIAVWEKGIEFGHG